VTCGVLDIANSHLALVSFDGEDDAEFTLLATIIDDGSEVQLFSWDGTLDADAKRVALDSSVANLNDTAVKLISEILVRGDKSFSIRYDYTAPSNPAAVKVNVVLRLHVASDKGTCPAQ